MKGKLLISTAKTGGGKKNKVVPIMEVPSVESECSSISIKPSMPVTNMNSARSSDRESFGFIPRKEPPIRKTLVSGGASATGTSMLLAKNKRDEVDSDNDKESFTDSGTSEEEIDLESNKRGASLNFSDGFGAGKISDIEFRRSGEVVKGGVEISFDQSDEVKGGRRSNFNEELLNSSGS